MNSNELKKQAESEENDLKAMGLYTKVLREERAERFESYKDKLLQAGYNLTEFEAQGKFTIEPTKFGIIDYYQKSNVLHKTSSGIGSSTLSTATHLINCTALTYTTENAIGFMRC